MAPTQQEEEVGGLLEATESLGYGKEQIVDVARIHLALSGMNVWKEGFNGQVQATESLDYGKEKILDVARKYLVLNGTNAEIRGGRLQPIPKSSGSESSVCWIHPP